MSAKWWSKSWNPVVGCSPASPGCAHCYAATLASRRLAHLPAYSGLAFHDRWTGKISVNEDSLCRGGPTSGAGILFVCNMGDLFHAQLDDLTIMCVLEGADCCGPGLLPLVLTKRAERMRDLMGRYTELRTQHRQPPTRIWCGVTVEDQQRADERIPLLLETPCAGRFLSVEPLLEPVRLELRGIDWVVVGGESGHNARRCDVAWVASVLDQCRQVGVPCYVKQLGAWSVNSTPLPVRVTGAGSDPERWPACLRSRELPRPLASPLQTELA